MSADLLRRAAKAMRERAENIVPADAPYHTMVAAHSGTALDHALSWHPAVALAVADLLDGIAAGWESNPKWADQPLPLAVARAYLGETP